jgi:hypothetical protein
VTMHGGEGQAAACLSTNVWNGQPANGSGASAFRVQSVVGGYC